MRRRLLLEENNKLYLYKQGNQCTSITGGWIREKIIEFTNSPIEVFQDKYMEFHCKDVRDYTSAATINNKIIFSNFISKGYKYLYIDVEIIVATNGKSTWQGNTILSTKMNGLTNAQYNNNALNWLGNNKYIDISTLKDGFFNIFTLCSANTEIHYRVHNIYFCKEKG